MVEILIDEAPEQCPRVEQGPRLARVIGVVARDGQRDEILGETVRVEGLERVRPVWVMGG